MQTQIKKSKRRRSAAPLGGLLLALTIVGVVTVVVASIRLTTGFLDNNKEKRMFENIIRPVLMFNPSPFEDPTTIEMPSLLQYSMWATLTGEKRGLYEYDDNTELIVPATDVDVAAAKLFGPEVKLVHKSFGDSETKYWYNEKEEVYNVPITAVLQVYSPLVEDIVKEGEFYNLKVGYVPPDNPWTTDYFGNTESAPVPDKYMIYVMRKVSDGYQLVKVQDPPPEEQSSADTPSQSVAQ